MRSKERFCGSTAGQVAAGAQPQFFSRKEPVSLRANQRQRYMSNIQLIAYKQIWLSLSL